MVIVLISLLLYELASVLARRTRSGTTLNIQDSLRFDHYLIMWDG